jgi:hypothetical protein
MLPPPHITPPALPAPEAGGRPTAPAAGAGVARPNQRELVLMSLLRRADEPERAR